MNTHHDTPDACMSNILVDSWTHSLQCAQAARMKLRKEQRRAARAEEECSKLRDHLAAAQAELAVACAQAAVNQPQHAARQEPAAMQGGAPHHAFDGVLGHQEGEGGG